MELELFSCPFATTPTPVTSLRYPLLFLFLSIFFSRNPTPLTDLKILLQKHRTRSGAGFLNVVVTAFELCVHNSARSPCFPGGGGSRSAFFRFLNTPAPAKNGKKDRNKKKLGSWSLAYAMHEPRPAALRKINEREKGNARQGSGAKPPRDKKKKKDTRACVRSLARSLLSHPSILPWSSPLLRSIEKHCITPNVLSKL
jgi:hypothetical protein